MLLWGVACSGESDDSICLPETCESLGASCGLHYDGCGVQLDCDAEMGGCASGETCDADGVCESQEECSPQTCESLEYECGQHDDGCGGELDCDQNGGGCASVETCSEGSCEPPPCNLYDSPTPSGICSGQASWCLEMAESQAETEACLDDEPDCRECIDGSYQSCIVGTPESPGNCAVEFGCNEDCLRNECAPDFDDACVAEAIDGPCAQVHEEYLECSDPSLSENVECKNYVEINCKTFPELCTLNPAPTDELSTSEDDPIFEGNFLEGGGGYFSNYENELDGVHCDLTFRDDAIYAWTAPADGIYEFVLDATETYGMSGFDPIESDYMNGALEIFEGHECAPPHDSYGCSSHIGNSYTPVQLFVELEAGEDVLVVASHSVRHYDEGDSVQSMDIPYEVWISSCEPSCSDRECGSDGCGGSCGECDADHECEDGIFECVPDCWGRECGDDGCGGSCGDCASFESCSDGSCVCVPDCDGKDCGPDGCGGSCGNCDVAEDCSGSGVCEPEECNPVDGSGCELGEGCMVLSDESIQCAVMGDGSNDSPCDDTGDCKTGTACFEGSCQKICHVDTATGCEASAETCHEVNGWLTYGVCSND